MSELITQTARLVPYVKRPKQAPSYVCAYAYEPMPDDPGADMGNLFIVMEVLVSGRASVEVAELVIETVGDHYYNNPDTSLAPATRFENAIKALNHELGEYVNRGNASWIGKLSTIIGVQVGTELHIAQTGSAEAFLYRDKAVTRINASAANKPHAPTKTFGAIATGKLEPGDRFLLATPALIHQVPLTRLQSIVSQSLPNIAIAEISDLLKGVSVERVGALIVEVTTPELAALQVRTAEPPEIQLKAPETALEAAKSAATPIAQTTIASSKKVAAAANQTWKKSRPTTRNATRAAYERLRKLLPTAPSRSQLAKAAIVSASVLALLVVIVVAHSILANPAPRNIRIFKAAAMEAQQASNDLAHGNLSGARTYLDQAQSMTQSLSSKSKLVNQELDHASLATTIPRSLSALAYNLRSLDAETANLTPVTASNVATFASSYGSTDHFEIYNGKAFVFGSGYQNSLTIVNLQTGTTTASSADVAQLGTIAATTLASNDSGIYVLTNAQAMWFYRFSTDTIAQVSTAGGQWLTGKAIATYGTNIYVLHNNAVYKYEAGSYEFDNPIKYVTAPGTSTALAIDGTIYLAGARGISDFEDGNRQDGPSLPAMLGYPLNLRSVMLGSALLAIDPASQRITAWLMSGNQFTGLKQLIIIDYSDVSDVSYDNTTSALYALAGQHLVRINAKI